MQNKLSLVLLLFSLFSLCYPIYGDEVYGTKKLNGLWKLKGYDKGRGVIEKVFRKDCNRNDFLPIRIPGTVRQALLEAGEIEDPYYGLNNEKSLWVEEKEWWFCRDFEVSSDIKGRYVELNFEGINFKGDVWFNGEKLGEVKGMFNPYSFDVSRKLNYGGKNTIVIKLQTPDDATDIQKSKGLTFVNRHPKRKQLHSIAQCLYGWDWGPHQMPIGIWKDVELRYSGPVKVNNPYILTSIESENMAVVDVSLEVENLSDEERVVNLDVVVKGKGFSTGVIRMDESVTISAGKSREVKFKIDVDKPRLWWPNGMGKQNLYILEAEVSSEGEVSDGFSETFGIRELKMVENEGVKEFIKRMKDEKGMGIKTRLGKVVGSYPWTFMVNGKKMFAKGANWIPIDQQLRVDRERYEHLIKLAKEAHMNLFRVWGGGLYETEDFYELCDEYGIMTWQDFLSNKDFSDIDRESFFEGVIASVKSIRNHPSLTFYCGGNEFDPDDKGSKFIIDSLENILKELDPSREFHRASPYMGDDHYWGVWHGQEPYTNYRLVRPFRSEAGINSFPVVENYKKFTPLEYLWPLDMVYIEYRGERQARSRGGFPHLNKLRRYANEFGPSESLDEFIMKSQLYQAIGNKFNMEFCRVNKFKNSGLLYWQYNDIWPAISWAFVDWYGSPKPCYYWVKRASRPIHISADYEKYLWEPGEEFTADIYLLNDTYSSHGDLSYEVKLFDVGSNVLIQKSGRTSVGENKSVKIDRISWDIPDNFGGKSFIVSVRLFKDGKLASESTYPIACGKIWTKTENWEPNFREKFYNILGELNELPQVKLKTELSSGVVRLSNDDTGNLAVRLINPSDKIAFFIRVKLDTYPEVLFPFFEDNYFTLLPGESRVVNVKIENKDGISKSLSTKLLVSGWNSPLLELPIRINVEE